MSSPGPPGLSLNPNIIYEDLPKVPSLATTHGTLMGLAFVVVFPLGAVLIRVVRSGVSVWMHAACQLVGLALTIAGLAIGIRIGKILDRLHNNIHTILGTVVVSALLIQPFLGYIHHRRYLSTRKATTWTHIHVWYGRVLLLLGIINGGVGLKLAADTPAHSNAGTIAYSILAGVVGVGLLALIVVVTTRKKEEKSEREG